MRIINGKKLNSCVGCEYQTQDFYCYSRNAKCDWVLCLFPRVKYCKGCGSQLFKHEIEQYGNSCDMCVELNK